MATLWTITTGVGIVAALAIIIALGILACDAFFKTDLDDAAGICRGQSQCDKTFRPEKFCSRCGHELDPKDSDV